MNRLAREIRAFFRHPLLIGITALLASLVGGIWILVFYGARSLLAAAAAYGACGVLAYWHQRQVRRGFESGLGTLIFGLIIWPVPVILHAYEVMQWGDTPSRFYVYVMPSLEKTSASQDLGKFRKWDEAVDCARQKAKELNADVAISDAPHRWYYLVDTAGRIERRKIS